MFVSHTSTLRSRCLCLCGGGGTHILKEEKRDNGTFYVRLFFLLSVVLLPFPFYGRSRILFFPSNLPFFWSPLSLPSLSSCVFCFPSLPPLSSCVFCLPSSCLFPCSFAFWCFVSLVFSLFSLLLFSSPFFCFLFFWTVRTDRVSHLTNRPTKFVRSISRKKGGKKGRRNTRLNCTKRNETEK